MKLLTTIPLILCFLLISTLGVIAQPNKKKDNKKQEENEEEMFYIADGYIDSENFENSIRLYQRVLDEEPDNPTVNFKLGFCYLNTSEQKEKAIQYIEKSVKYFEKKKKRLKKRRTEYLESYFYLAKAYQAIGKFDTAISRYKNLKAMVSNQKLIKVIDQEITNTAKTRALLQDSSLSNITNLSNINSKYSDHSAFVSADESVLLFTSRRENQYNDFLDYDEEYDENIFICYKQPDGTWSKPKSIGDNINTSYHEAVIGLSADGQQLFIYKSDDKGSIYLSTLIGDVWSKPKKLGSNINTKHRETSASLSADGSTLYFTSDRNGGFGGLDIYCSKKQANGTWGKAENLGPTINTGGDERAPYIHADGKTLYFSSKGHISIGGFDIFSSKKNEFGTWTKPENLGYPINTILDDIYYVGTADGKRSYYTSSRKDGLGKTDIYMIDLKDAAFEPEITVMKGKVSVANNGKIPEISILVKDKKTDKVVGIYVPNSKTGKYLFVLDKGKKYVVEFYTDEGMFYKENICVKKTSAYQQEHKEIVIPTEGDSTNLYSDTTLITVYEKDTVLHIASDSTRATAKDTMKIGHKIGNDSVCEIQNILLPSNSKKIAAGNQNLDTLAKYLVKNPDAIVEVGAYADAKGSAYYNYKLSLQRANYVKLYLLKRKVKSKQIKTVAYGEENPIALNKNKNGSWNAQGKKYNRRIEFRIIKQGKTKIVVNPLDIPKSLVNTKYAKDYKKDKNKHIEIKY